MASPEAQPARIRVRMYRQGLGDCFLISLLPDAGQAFHLMIDCGVILGTTSAGQKLATVVKDVIATTGGKIDVLAVTHEHYDHVAGFVLADDLFAKLSIGEVWFAWTEDPGNIDAQKLADSRKKRVAALAGLSARLHGMGLASNDRPIAATAALAFFGVDSSGKGVGATRQAMMNAAGFAPSKKYCKPGDILDCAQAPGLKFYVLGPPDSDLIRKTDSPAEVYHLSADHLEEAVDLATAGGADPASWDPYAPFDPAWSHPLSQIVDGNYPAPIADFLHDNYFGVPEPDLSWRRIDGAWLDGAEELGLALDNATNNTSLVLAIELVGTGRILLFPADAQVGNWLSWHQINWSDPKISAADLLGRTIFYKVGHHGSHNATLKAKGLELMPKTGLTAFVPVDHDMAVKKGWGQMPLPGLVDALHERCGDQLVRIDQPLPPGIVDVVAGPETDGITGPLYYEWSTAL
jgi:hypothetical protein